MQYTASMMQHAAVGIGIVIRRVDGKILLLQRKGSHGEGSWSVPGGHIDYGESLEHCAVREVREEVCIEVGSPHLIGISNDVVLCVYICRCSIIWSRSCGLI